MNRLLFVIDEISTWIGKTAGWCILVLTFTISYEVFSRYVFLAPTDWAFDASYMLYGTLFMMAGAYALVAQRPCARRLPLPLLAAAPAGEMDLVLYFLFFFPGMLAFIYAGYGFAKLSWMMNEHSASSPDGPAGLSFQDADPDRRRADGDAGHGRSRPLHHVHPTGEWPQRLHDVEELDKIILEKAEHGEFEVVKELEEIGARKGSI